ncbi:MAG: hypothetical protein PHP13_00010 [Methanomicrobium sp.]|nr:hypothetical protein [Methanomicrobium sp.]
MPENKKLYKLLIVAVTAFFVLSINAAAADTIAKGDTVFISGTATGDPQQGLAIWVFGTNYWTRETKSFLGKEFEYEISGSKTENMAEGEYFCIVQHPMYNGVFDADLSTSPSGQTTVASSSGNSFVIDGAGKLQGRSAAYALMKMLDSPDIDDTYIFTEFTLSAPWILFTPEKTYYAGDVIMISGSTNIAAGEKLLYEVYSASFEPSQKSRSSEFSGASGYTEVWPSSGENRWQFQIDTGNMNPDMYLVKISRDDGSAAYSAEFTLEKERPPHVAEETTAFSDNGPSAEESASENLSGEEKTPSAGAGVFSIFISLGFAFAFFICRKGR